MTTSKLTLADAIAMLAQAVDEPVESLQPERARDTIPGWDSMGALLLMSEIDERFGVELSADESRAMTRVADILEFLRQHQLLQD